MKKVRKIQELNSILENEEGTTGSIEILNGYNMKDLEEIIGGPLPDYILTQDNAGNLVYDISYINGVTARKISTKIVGYGINPSPKLISALSGNKEAFDSLPDFIYYESTVDDSFIGDDSTFDKLLREGITYFTRMHEGSDTAQLGFIPHRQAWCGWSHRAWCAFEIGDTVELDDIVTTSGLTDEYRLQHPEEDRSLPVGYVAYNLNDAKAMAVAFVDAVS